MRTVSTKVDNSFDDQVVSRCNVLGCTKSQYVKNLITEDLAGGKAQAKPIPMGRWVSDEEPHTWRQNKDGSWTSYPDRSSTPNAQKTYRVKLG